MSKAKSRDDPAGWWRLWPGLYQEEMQAFARRRAGVREIFSRNGVLILEVKWPDDAGGTIRLLVGYSPLHPHSRPSISAPDLDLERHQNPLTRGLCLITQDSGQWYPAQRVADYIHERLPRVFEAVNLRREERWTEAAEVEEQAPDPRSTYFTGLAEEHSAIFFGDEMPTPAEACGIARFAVQSRPWVSDPQVFQAILQRVDPLGQPWMAQPFQLPKPVGEWQQVVGRWIRIEPPTTDNPEELLASAHREIERACALEPGNLEQLTSLAEADISITALLFDEEVGYAPKKIGNGWLFLVARRDPKNRTRRIVALVRGYRVSKDIFTRVPVANTLGSKKALLVGCGAIGSFVAVELARAGIGHLTLADFDVVEPGNTVRWAIGRSAWGLRKSFALFEFLQRNYPLTDVAAWNWQIGVATADVAHAEKAKVNQLSELRNAIATADIVIDASASTECQQALAYHCREAGKPYIVGYGTEGAVGGIVARFDAASPACFVCLHNHWDDGLIELPPIDRQGTVLPIGCNAPTFTGGAFDLQEVSLELVRSAIGFLASEEYDPGDWQLATLALTREGRRRLPSWRAEKVEPHARCCGGKLP